MELADPVHNVELRPDPVGNPAVVFAFPYQRDIVEAMRGIPGRRFDWQTKEWWAPRADAVAPYIRGVLERHPSLSVAPDVERWLAGAVTGWVGRVTAQRRDGRGHFVLETIAGKLEPELAERAEELGGRLWLPFDAEVAEALLELKSARLDPRALRCAMRLRVGIEPPPADLVLIESVEEPRFKLEVNWDPDTVASFLNLPACESHGRTLPVDPFLLEALERYLRTYGVEPSAKATDALRALRHEHDHAIDDIRRSKAIAGTPLAVEQGLGGELRPFQRAGVDYILHARRTFLADEQGLGKTVQALAALEADDAYPAVIVCPAGLKLNWRREIETWLPHR